ncbi:TPA: tRNA 2-thiouridine(34) synthase MnmA, partial [Candidatus Beckwithbacteria bacterium]|nr:tRNA 2-thiouridine(34) synthase MnmA [Candidatus Beckwithbacteria bacterium]
MIEYGMRRGKIKVAVGISGGVDSALAAALLKEKGFDVTGVFMECWNEPGCRTDEDRKDALKVALKLKIPFKVLDFKKEYKRKVVDWFFGQYQKGRTPNPDIVCNREIKFGRFLSWAEKHGFDYIATGHYARI